MSSKPSSVSEDSGTLPRAQLLSRIRTSGPFGFGASSLGNLYAEMSDAEAVDVVDAAWAAGIRLFDTAPFYGFGLSERRLGDALRPYPREEMIVSTKAGRLLKPDADHTHGYGFDRALPFRPVFDYSYDGILRSVDDSLSRLGIDRIDILMMHDLGCATHGPDHGARMSEAVAGGFRAMERLRIDGTVGAIGLGVNEVEVCIEALDHFDPDLFLIANRYTLLDTSADDFFARCALEGRGMLAAGVFSSGILATGTNSGSVARFDYATAPAAVMDRVASMELVCARFGISIAAAAHQFVRAHSGVTQTLLGLRDRAQLDTALADLDQVIPEDFWTELRRSGLVPPPLRDGAA